jgi:hypothetical protein
LCLEVDAANLCNLGALNVIPGRIMLNLLVRTLKLGPKDFFLETVLPVNVIGPSWYKSSPYHAWRLQRRHPWLPPILRAARRPHLLRLTTSQRTKHYHQSWPGEPISLVSPTPLRCLVICVVPSTCQQRRLVSQFVSKSQLLLFGVAVFLSSLLCLIMSCPTALVL